jgi:hypothetical protein
VGSATNPTQKNADQVPVPVHKEIRSDFAQDAPRVFYEATSRQLSNQLQAIDSVDGKAATIFIFASAIIAVLGAFLGVHPSHPPGILYGLIGASMVTYVALVVIILFAYRIRHDWEDGPRSKELEDMCGTNDVDVAQIMVGRAYAGSLAANDERMNQKSWWLGIAMCLLPVEVLLLAATGLTVIASK